MILHNEKQNLATSEYSGQWEQNDSQHKPTELLHKLWPLHGVPNPWEHNNSLWKEYFNGLTPVKQYISYKPTSLTNTELEKNSTSHHKLTSQQMNDLWSGYYM